MLRKTSEPKLFRTKIAPSTATGERVGYHITSPQSIESIGRKGLTPAKPNLDDPEIEAKGVYLARDEMNDTLAEGAESGHPILRVRIPKGHATYEDPYDRYWNRGDFLTKKAIPPENITKWSHGWEPMHSTRGDILEDYEIKQKMERTKGQGTK